MGHRQNEATLYVPLDDRPPNWAPCDWGLAQCPPRELYKGREGADPAALAGWLLATPGRRAVVSLDALTYGGLVQSRASELGADEARLRAGPLLEWKARHGGEVSAFGVIPRHPDAKNRQRNLEVLRGLGGLAGPGGGFDYLEAPWDDALPGSPAVAEAATLPIPTRPGADEAGQLLLLRALRPGLRVKVLYDDPAAAQTLGRYEGIALDDTVNRLLRAAAAERVEERPDLVLLVYSGRNPREGTLAVLRGLREGRVAVADLSRVNRGDALLVRYLVSLGVYPSLAAYAAWGTAANNLGAALAQGGLSEFGVCARAGWEPGRCTQARQERLGRAYLEFLWGEVGRPWVRERFPEPLSEEAARYTLERIQSEPTPRFEGGRLRVLGLEFPWRRSFEALWRFRLVGEAP